jgi:hypothetical protein
MSLEWYLFAISLQGEVAGRSLWQCIYGVDVLMDCDVRDVLIMVMREFDNLLMVIMGRRGNAVMVMMGGEAANCVVCKGVSNFRCKSLLKVITAHIN